MVVDCAFGAASAQREVPHAARAAGVRHARKSGSFLEIKLNIAAFPANARAPSRKNPA